MAAVRRLGSLKFKFLTIWTVKKPILHHHAKFCEDRSNRCWDITIFMIFKTAVATILDIQKFEILSVSPLSEANMLHHAKLHQNQSNGCGDMAI